MYGFPVEIQQFWNLDEIMDSINVAKIEYNIEIWRFVKISRRQEKLGTPKRLMKPDVLEQKSMMVHQDKKKELSKSLWNLSFLNDFDDNDAQEEVTQYEILSMAAATARLWGTRDGGPKWRSKQFWAWLQPQQDSEVQATKEESRFWTALQFGWKVPTPSLEGKVGGPQWISRLRARTPCCKQLFGEQKGTAPTSERKYHCWG